MKKIFYNHHQIGKLSDSEYTALSLLLPYWGLTLRNHSGEITSGLDGFFIHIDGLHDSFHNQLEKLLRHTGIVFSNNAQAHLTVELIRKTSAPITLLTDKKNFYLKPLRKETTDVQKWIHKRLWLPVNEQDLTLTFHQQEANNTPEWLCYLTIQMFLRRMFEPLNEISFEMYQSLVFEILKEINNDFAECQLFLLRPLESQWPELPFTSGKSSTVPESIDGSTEAFNPFKKTEKTKDAEPINPFQSQSQSNKNTKINPFRKK